MEWKKDETLIKETLDTHNVLYVKYAPLGE